MSSRPRPPPTTFTDAVARAAAAAACDCESLEGDPDEGVRCVGATAAHAAEEVPVDATAPNDGGVAYAEGGKATSARNALLAFKGGRAFPPDGPGKAASPPGNANGTAIIPGRCGTARRAGCLGGGTSASPVHATPTVDPIGATLCTGACITAGTQGVSVDNMGTFQVGATPLG